MGRPLSASRWLSANVWVPPSDRWAAGRTRPSLRRRHTFSRGKSEVRKQAGGWKKPEATEAKRRGPGRQLPSRAPPAAQGCSWPSALAVSPSFGSRRWLVQTRPLCTSRTLTALPSERRAGRGCRGLGTPAAYFPQRCGAGSTVSAAGTGVEGVHPGRLFLPLQASTGIGDGQGGLAGCGPQGRRESGTTERLN